MNQSKSEIGQEIEEVLKDKALTKAMKSELVFHLITSSAERPNQIMPKPVFDIIFSLLENNTTMLEVRKKFSRACTLHSEKIPEFNQFRVFKHLMELSDWKESTVRLSENKKKDLKDWYLKRLVG